MRVSIRGEGRPLLLIMGLGGNIEMWDPLERALTDRGIQTIAYDASGTGDSPPRLVPQRMHGLARQAAHVLDALGHPDADVLGVSFGGAVAQELTLANPHRVRRLVLASTTCGLGGVPGNPLALALLATPLRYYSPAFLRLTANVLYGPGASERRGPARATRSTPAGPGRRALWGYVGQLVAGDRLDEPPVAAPHPHADLVLSGAEDPIVPPINARILARRIPNAELEIVPDAGHLLLMEHAEPVVRANRHLPRFAPHKRTPQARRRGPKPPAAPVRRLLSMILTTDAGHPARRARCARPDRRVHRRRSARPHQRRVPRTRQGHRDDARAPPGSALATWSRRC